MAGTASGTGHSNGVLVQENNITHPPVSAPSQNGVVPNTRPNSTDPAGPQSQPVATGTPRLDSLYAIRAYIAADGDARMAAKLLHTDESSLIAAIIMDETSHEILARYTRTHTVMRTFGLIGKLNGAIEDAIDSDELRPVDMVKLMNGLLEQISRLTDVRNTRLGGDDAGSSGAEVAARTVLTMLPPHIRQAVEEAMEVSTPLEERYRDTD